MTASNKMFRPPRRSTGEWKGYFRQIVDSSADTGALTPPTATTPTRPKGGTAGVMDCLDASVARLMFAGTDAANEIVNYQVILWYAFRNSEGQLDWVGREVANGVATLGTLAGPTRYGTIFMADGLTDTVGDDGTVVENPADDGVALLKIRLRGAQYLQVITDINTAATADVFAQLGDA